MANWKHAAEVAQQHKKQSMDSARTIIEAIKLYPCDHIENLQDLDDVRYLLRDAYERHKRLIRYSRKAEAQELVQKYEHRLGRVREFWGGDSIRGADYIRFAEKELAAVKAGRKW